MNGVIADLPYSFAGERCDDWPDFKLVQPHCRSPSSLRLSTTLRPRLAPATQCLCGFCTYHCHCQHLAVHSPGRTALMMGLIRPGQRSGEGASTTAGAAGSGPGGARCSPAGLGRAGRAKRLTQTPLPSLSLSFPRKMDPSQVLA